MTIKKKIKPKKTKVSIKGVEWVILLLPRQEFIRLATELEVEEPEETAALTEYGSKSIVFHEDDTSMVTVLHELVHVFAFYCYHQSANLKSSELEEIYCEMLAHNFHDMGRVSKKIFTFLRKNSRLDQ